jgi:plasmid replication initiation protein
MKNKWVILSFLSKAPALSLITSASVIQSGRKVESLSFEIQKKEREQNILHQNLAKKKNSTPVI